MPVFHQIFDLDWNTNALGVRQYACIDFVQSNEKSNGQSDAQSFCGIKKDDVIRVLKHIVLIMYSFILLL